MIKYLNAHIRIAKLEDAKAIALVHICSWQKMYREFIPEVILKNLSLQERTQQWAELIKQDMDVLVIEINERIVGFASVCQFRDQHIDRSMGEISAIYIHPDNWRMGFGRQLCLAAIAELTKQHYKTIGLWVLVANIQARQFYDALGFEATSVTKLEEFYEGGALLQEILYRKSLS
ncbi:MAG: GNAT family N-acetyltransferase [Legionella sp.]|uniref:GNAT family N-acetyltransferase n=1 Tax=Legionella sp. TaxID=459 RepID=UPI0039E4EF8C